MKIGTNRTESVLGCHVCQRESLFVRRGELEFSSFGFALTTSHASVKINDASRDV
jgi:hypothetical protein